MAMNPEQKEALSPLLGSVGLGMIGGILGASIPSAVQQQRQQGIIPPMTPPQSFTSAPSVPFGVTPRPEYQGNGVPGRGGLPDAVPAPRSNRVSATPEGYAPRFTAEAGTLEARPRGTMEDQPSEAAPAPAAAKEVVQDDGKSSIRRLFESMGQPLMQAGATMMQAGGWQNRPVDALSVFGSGLEAFSAGMGQQAALRQQAAAQQAEAANEARKTDIAELKVLSEMTEQERKNKDAEAARTLAMKIAEEDSRYLPLALSDPSAAIKAYTKATTAGPEKKVWTPFDIASAKSAAELVSEIGTAARDASESNARLVEFERAMNKVYTGFGSEAIKDLQGMLSLFGVKTEGLAEREVIASLAFKMATSIKTPGAVSNWEQQAFLKAVPGLAQSNRGNQLLVGLMRKVNEHNIRMNDVINQAIVEGRKADPSFNPDEAFFNKILADNPIFSAEDHALMDSIAANGSLPDEVAEPRVDTSKADAVGAVHVSSEEEIQKLPPGTLVYYNGSYFRRNGAK